MIYLPYGFMALCAISILKTEAFKCAIPTRLELSGDTCYFVLSEHFDTRDWRIAKRRCAKNPPKAWKVKNLTATLAMVDSREDMLALQKSIKKSGRKNVAGRTHMWLDGSNAKPEKPGMFVWHDAVLTPIDGTATKHVGPALKLELGLSTTWTWTS
ncbi:uncharacterized protein LOC129586705 isoform X2 [Paramacrobiotus metropolitanus]|uniref:uncharacterized protein LOC129586705 isoform X2 n=1 Tax=Paramacrobiotus metropolitanus TaxID=2943436 RepID=UPI002445A8D9|nr:uncharacterized protein LOC129586705 isoform X2 [Paramacrobiotus metropolitanus]